jgi:3-oxoacyl-[acyl-carrier protein] reductase
LKTVYNKNILIFGAGAGLGKTLALAFAREKANIVAVDNNKTGLDDLSREIGNLKANVKSYFCDLSSRKDAERILKEILRNHDTIDILVIGFYAENDQLYIKTSSEKIEKILFEQIIIPCAVIRNLFEHMSNRKESTIVSLPPTETASGSDGIIDGMSSAAVKSMIAETEKFSKSIRSHIHFINVELTGKKIDLFFASNSILDAVLKNKTEIRI